MESSLDTKEMSVIQTVVSQSVHKAFQRSALQAAVKRAVKKCSAELHVFKDVAINTIDASPITVPVATFVKNGIEKRSLENAEMNQYRNVSSKEVVALVKKRRTHSRHRKRTLQSIQVPQQNFLTIKRQIRRRIVPSLLRIGRIHAVISTVATRRGICAIKAVIITASQHLRCRRKILVSLV